MEDQSRLNVRIPGALRAKLDKYVEKRQEQYIRYCYNDAVVGALRNLVDGGYDFKIAEEAEFTPEPLFSNDKKKTAAELAAMIPGVTMGMPGKKSWRSVLGPVRDRWAVDPSQGAEDFMNAMGGDPPPGKFASWRSLPKVFSALVEYLDRERPL